MFVEFLSKTLADRQVCVTSAIGRLSVSTDAPSVTVTLSDYGGEFYRATLYAYDGKVTVDDLASVIELRIQSLGCHMRSVRIDVAASSDPEASDYMDLNCLYCAYDMPDDYDPSQSFFSCFQSQRVPPSAVLRLYGMIFRNSPVRYNVSGFKADGSPTACEIQSSAFDGYVAADIPSIIATCRSDYGMATVSIVTVYCSGLGKSLFICEMPDALEFRFRNCFNVPESVFVSGSSVMKTEVSSDQAVCAGQTTLYNQLTTRTYEHTTAPLTRMEAAAVSQLVESRSVYVVVDGSDYPVVITDHTSEVSNDDSSLNSLKFTWRFTGKRPRLFGDSLSPLMGPFGIFTQEFTDPYQ